MNDKLKNALFSGNYVCPECGNRMVFEDDQWKDSLVCENCGYSCDLNDYGQDPEEVEHRRITETAAAIESETYEDIYDED